MPQHETRNFVTLKELLTIVERNLLLSVPIRIEIESGGDIDKLQVKGGYLPLALVEIRKRKRDMPGL